MSIVKDWAEGEGRTWLGSLRRHGSQDMTDPLGKFLLSDALLMRVLGFASASIVAVRMIRWRQAADDPKPTLRYLPIEPLNAITASDLCDYSESNLWGESWLK
jgi:hypothetical protein